MPAHIESAKQNSAPCVGVPNEHNALVVLHAALHFLWVMQALNVIQLPVGWDHGGDRAVVLQRVRDQFG